MFRTAKLLKARVNGPLPDMEKSHKNKPFNSGTIHEGNLARVLQQWNCTRRESAVFFNSGTIHEGNLARVLQQWNYTRRESSTCSSTVELYTKDIYAVFFNSGTINEGNLGRVQQWNYNRRESRSCSSTVELWKFRRSYRGIFLFSFLF